jgi:hypothetical protein
MPRTMIAKRTRFFIACEGDSEQSLVTWLQRLSEGRTHIHLDSAPLDGGGFKSMLKNAIHLHHKRCNNKGSYQDRFLIVDEDRASYGDWTIEELSRHAASNSLKLVIQRPNHEGLLLRMFPNMEKVIVERQFVERKLRMLWPNYKKPENANALIQRFTIEDLLRVAKHDHDLTEFLRVIGLMPC